MIDFEPEVFTAVKTALVAAYPTITVESVPNYEPASFPFVCIEEADNYAYRSSQDTASNENHVIVMYEITAYSNLQSGRKRECRKIMSVCDGVMDSLGFSRSGLTPVSIDEGSKYRMVARYTAVISRNGIIYRR